MANCPDSVRISFHGKVRRDGPHLVPHSMAFPSAMMSLRVLMGGVHRTHDLCAHNRTWRSDEDYYLHLGLSGEGFRFLFDTAEYFRFGEEDDATPLLDCLAAEGIPAAVYAAKQARGVQGVWQDGKHLKALVMETLQKGFPALLLGRTESDWVILATGYEQSGDTLIGWTFVPGADMSNKSFDPEDCQHISGWLQGVDAAALVTGAPQPPADKTELMHRGLARGERFLRRAQGHPHGKTADFYEEWIGKLRDAAFWKQPFPDRPGIDPEIWDFAERRCFCAEFLEEAAQVLGTQALSPAIGGFREIHDLMWRLNSLCDGETAQEKLRDAGVRHQIVEIIETCRALDEKAAQAILSTLHKSKEEA